MQLNDRCRTVKSHQAAGTAQRLEEVRASLEDTQRRLSETEVKIKASTNLMYSILGHWAC